MVTLISALDWGLGHTTRTMPIIKKLLDIGDEVVVGGSKRQISIYRELFPNLEYVIMPSFSPTYGNKPGLIRNLLAQLPYFLFTIAREHFQLSRLIKTHKIEQVISDNRYGLFHKTIKSVFVGHQLNLQMPHTPGIIRRVINQLHKSIINQFDECWIPDFSTQNSLSGELSIIPAGLTSKVERIGILSRLSLVEEDKKMEAPTLLVLISGPEKQRTIFENYMLEALAKSEVSDYLLIRGLPGEEKSTLTKSMNHCMAPYLKALLKHSKYIICRAGYTSIMDLVSLNRTACLVPTPGQTEQEYLADYLSKSGKFSSCTQDNLDVGLIIQELQKLS